MPDPAPASGLSGNNPPPNRASLPEVAIIFDRLEWQSPQPGMRCKVFRDGTRQIRLVEFSPEFVEAEWCEKAHAGIVLSGELEIDFSGRTVRFPEGSALLIPPGAAYAHKARAVTPVTRVFLVEEILA
jgi:quercetin dioxygenase-like cupin family protein